MLKNIIYNIILFVLFLYSVDSGVIYRFNRV